MPKRHAQLRKQLADSEPGAIKEGGIAYILAEHDSHIKVLAARMSTVEDSITAIDAKIDRVIDAVAQKPSFDFHKVLDTITKLAVLVGAAVAAIVYVAGASFSGEIAVLKVRQDKVFELIEKRLGNRAEQK